MKLVLAVILSISLCFGTAPVITPSTPPVVKAGAVYNFIADQAVTWSLTSGSAGSINPTTGAYTAATGMRAHNVADGCPVFPNDAIFNTRIDNLPVHMDSATWLAQFSPQPLNLDEVSFPRNETTNSQPTEDLYLRYGSPPGAGPYPYHVPVGTNAIVDPSDFTDYPYQIEGSLYSDPFNGPDRHLFDVNQSDCSIDEIYKPYPFMTNPECNMFMLTCNAQSAVTFPYGYELRLGVDASGTSITALSARYSEIHGSSCEIKHGLRITMANGWLTNVYHVWPATNNSTAGGGLIPDGSILRLKSSVDISGFSAKAQCILLAMKRYGMYVNDGGITGHIQSAYDVVYDKDFMDAIYEIKVSSITTNDCEFVDQSTLDTGETLNGYPSARVDPTNAYVVPSDYSVVKACNMAMECSEVAVAVQPVTIGTLQTSLYQPVYSVMAGASQFQLPVVVHGSSTTTFSCTKTGSTGTLTSGGAYTAPATQADVQNRMEVTCAAIADSGATISFPIVVFPDDAIRVDTGGGASACASAFTPPCPYVGDVYGPDANGKYWYPDSNVFPVVAQADEWYPQTAWTSTPDFGLGVRRIYSGGDLIYTAHVPNGTYTVTYLFANKEGNSTPDPGTFASGTYLFDLEGHWLLQDTGFDICTLMTPSCQRGQTQAKTESIVVSDGILSFALRWYMNGTYVTLGAVSAELSMAGPYKGTTLKGPSGIRNGVKF